MVVDVARDSRLGASAATLDLVRTNLFNHTIWPDFFALSATTPDGDRFVWATPIEPFVAVERDGFRVTPVPVSHGTDTLAEAAQGQFVRIRGVVTVRPRDYVPTEAAIVQDDTGGVWVSLERLTVIPEELERGVTVTGGLLAGGGIPQVMYATARAPIEV